MADELTECLNYSCNLQQDHTKSSFILNGLSISKYLTQWRFPFVMLASIKYGDDLCLPLGTLKVSMGQLKRIQKCLYLL